MTVIGYARVSTTHQKLDSQIEALNSYKVDHIYREFESGRKNDRVILEKVLQSLKPGDTLVISKLDRLARSAQHLLKLLDFFEKNQINFVSIDNNINTSTPMGKLVFTIMGAFAEMEASLIRERVLAGLQAAKNRGVQLGRPSDTTQIDQAIELYQQTDSTVAVIAKKCGISSPTLYRHLNKREIALRG